MDARHPGEVPVPGPPVDEPVRLVDPGRGRVAEEGEGETEHRRGRSFRARRRGRALRELGARRIGGDGHVRVGGLREAKGTLNVDLGAGGGKKVGAAHDLGDAEHAVIHRRCQVVGMHPVGPVHDEVAGLGREIDRNVPLHAVAKVHAGAGLHPDRARRARGSVAAGAGVGSGPRFAPGACAAERPSIALETGEGAPVAFGVVALADHRAVPGKGEALELAQDRVRRARDRPRDIHVVDAHVPFAAPAPGAEMARESRDHRAEVQRTVRGRGETPAYRPAFPGRVSPMHGFHVSPTFAGRRPPRPRACRGGCRRSATCAVLGSPPAGAAGRHPPAFPEVRWCRVTAGMRPFPENPASGVCCGPGGDRFR